MKVYDDFAFQVTWKYADDYVEKSSEVFQVIFEW